MKDSPRVWTGLLPLKETNPNQDSLYPLGSSWRKGMLRLNIEDICESDEDMEGIEKNFDKEGTYYRKCKLGIRET